MWCEISGHDAFLVRPERRADRRVTAEGIREYKENYQLTMTSG